MRRVRRWRARIVGEVQASEVPRAVAAAMSAASSVDLIVEDVIVLQLEQADCAFAALTSYR
jgi:hypothetical protein